MKTCLKCYETKEEYQFHQCSRNSDGLHTYCKSCRNAYMRPKQRAYNRTHKKERAAYYQTYYSKNKDKIIAQQLQWKRDNKDRIREYHRKRYLLSKLLPSLTKEE